MSPAPAEAPRLEQFTDVWLAEPDVKVPRWALAILAAVILVCSVYANLSFTVKNQNDYRLFPPFQPGVNANLNSHLGGEYYQMAKALARGEGFSHPFDRPTGPTAWQPPVLPLILASLLWASHGSQTFVTAVVVCLQALVLLGTGVLVLALIRQTTRLPVGVALAVFVGALVGNFWLCFQYTHDGWLVLLTLDVLLGVLMWVQPLEGWPGALGWGVFGGLAAMVNPGLGLAWLLLSGATARRQRAWSPLLLALIAAMLTLAPWTVRNYLQFGRFIPTKSNLFYEMYQSHCLQKEALLEARTFRFHPFRSGRRERLEYERLGEADFMDRKRQQWWQAVEEGPLDYADRVVGRFLGATLWYVPFREEEAQRRPWAFWIARLTHPLPFLALLGLLLSSRKQALGRFQVLAMGAYIIYLLPYVMASYYERYGFPLLGVKVLFVLWALDRGWTAIGLKISAARSLPAIPEEIGQPVPEA
jgi:hypothetical protein